MQNFLSTLKKALLEIPLRRPAPDQIPRSGDAGRSVDCYTIQVIREGVDALLVRAAEDNKIELLEWNGSQFAVQSTTDFDSLLKDNLQFTHYYGLWEITYEGWLSLALGRLFRLPYIKAWIHDTRRAAFQSLYNRRKFVTRERIDLLKVVLDAQLNGRNRVSSLTVMSLLHTDRWYFHPNRNSEHRRVLIYLDALAETNELFKSNIEYRITGHGIAAIERYEEQERKHSESIAGQRRMFLLTVVIALLTIVQVGLIRLPPLLDLVGR